MPPSRQMPTLQEALDVVNATVEKYMAVTPRVHSEVVPQILADLRKFHHKELAVWQDSLGYSALMSMMRSRDSQDRATARNPRRQIGEAIEAMGQPDGSGGWTGGLEPISVFRAAVFTVDAANTRKTVGEMTSTDHLYVSGRYGAAAKQAQVEAAFHRVIAKQIPEGKITSDVFSEQEYMDLRERVITGRGKPRELTT